MTKLLSLKILFERHILATPFGILETKSDLSLGGVNQTPFIASPTIPKKYFPQYIEFGISRKL